MAVHEIEPENQEEQQNRLKKVRDKSLDVGSKVKSKSQQASAKLKDSLKSHENYNQYAAIGYIPIIGWLIPYFGKKESDHCQFHAKQSAIMALLFITVMAIVWILNNLPILSHILSWIGIKTFIIPAISYTVVALYLIISAFAAYKAYQGERWQAPLLDKIQGFLADLFTVQKKKDGETKSESPKDKSPSDPGRPY
jgi:uncharacterized membrane protein